MASKEVIGPNPNHRKASELPAIKRRLEMLLKQSKNPQSKAKFAADIAVVNRQMGVK